MDHPLLNIILNHEMKIYQEILLIYLNDEIPTIQDYFNTNKDILI